MRVIAAEPDITNYDTIVGDGDCGIGLKRGAEGEFLVIYAGDFSSNQQSYP
jgi:dihydroxyacetone kinase